MKSKTKAPPLQVTAFSQDCQVELRQTYQSWAAKNPETMHWHNSRAKTTGWWDIAADACYRYSVPAPLLFFIVFAHANSRAEDAEIPFSATSFRSQHVLDRAIANWRSFIGVTLKHLEPLYKIEHGFDKEMIVPRGTLEAGRLAAKMVCQYFATNLEVLEYAVTRSKWKLDDEQRDVLAYKLAFQDRNPFVLLKEARTPRMRSLAASNAFLLCDSHPWHRQVWEGIASEHSLDRVAELAQDSNPERFFRDNRLQYAWPVNPFRGDLFYELDVEQLKRPFMVLSGMRICEKTDLFLAAKVHHGSRDLR